MEWWISRLCEEFPGRLPSEVLKEWERAPSGLLETILEMRAFAGVKRQSDAAKTAAEMPQGTLADLLLEIQAEEIERAHDGR